MKKMLLFSIFLSLTAAGRAQVVINEISYNPPESGTDSLEYIELLNAGDTPVNLLGWHFQAGIEDTFPDVTLGPGEYFVTAVSASAMQNVFGLAVHQWIGGGLNNGGELLWLVDENGSLIDSVRYDDADPWPVEPDGNGPSLELKSTTLDNDDGANWQYSGGNTGVIINGLEVSGTPGAQNSGGGTPGPDVTIELANFSFQPNVVVVRTGDVIRWVNNEAIAHNVNGNLSTYPDNPEGFFSGGPTPGPWQFDFEFNTPGIYNYRCDPHFGQGMTGIVYVYDPLGYNEFPLEALRSTNANGQALFDGVPTFVQGVVHGPNFQPSGYSFYVVNGNNVGINVFSFDPASYTVTEGDELIVFGMIDQFNGLLEIIPDSIVVNGGGRPLNMPWHVDEVSEAEEGSYLQASELTIDSISNISASGYTIYTTSGGGSKHLQVRVDADAGIGFGPGDLQPGAAIVALGVGSQFDPSFPFTDGYQILAFEVEVLQAVERLDPARIALYPNPTSDYFRLEADIRMEALQVINAAGQVVRYTEPNALQGSVNMLGMPAGLYTVRVTTGEGEWSSRVLKIN